MPRKKQQPFADLVNGAVDTAVDAFFDRASEAVGELRQRARQVQHQRLPADYAAGLFKCAGCKQEFSLGQMEQVHPSNGWGTCQGCYGFMWRAAREKAKHLMKEQAKRVQEPAQAQPRPSAGYQPPPPPHGPPPWEILGVAQDAMIDDIKKAYRRKAMLYHPDRVSASASYEEQQRARQMFEALTRARDVMLKVRSAPEA